MSILFSGDFHANHYNELHSISRKTLLQKYYDKYSLIKYHIILGDGNFGFNVNDKINYSALAMRPFPILCVIGNTDPILKMRNLPEVDIGIGEKVYLMREKPFVAYLKRGRVYTIDGIKCLVLGGALSDRDKLKPNIAWWESEYWSEREKEDLFRLLETDNKFDCVLSHTGPHHKNIKVIERYKKLYVLFSDYDKKVYNKFAYLDKIALQDKVALLNDEIHNKIDFRQWLCGHLHKDDNYYDEESDRGYQYLYNDTIMINKEDDKIKTIMERWYLYEYYEQMKKEGYYG